MAYNHHVFISYARVNDTLTGWVSSFKQRLEGKLREKLPGETALVYLDLWRNRRRTAKIRTSRGSLLQCDPSSRFIESLARTTVVPAGVGVVCRSRWWAIKSAGTDRFGED